MDEIIECNSPIAILMATYNGEEYLEDQLDSIIRQKNSEWELFIHDDGSTDCTQKILEKYSKKNSEKIHLLKGSATGGAKNNFFYLMKHVSASYYMFCDQDDYWLDNKVSKTYMTLLKEEQKNKNQPILVYTDLKVVDSDLNIVAEKMSEYQNFDTSRHTPEEFLSDNNVTGCTVMINRKLRDMSCRASDYSKVIMHDWWLALLASRFGIVKYVPDSLILYRQHGDNSIGALKFGNKYIVRRFRNSQDVHKRLEGTRIQARYLAELFSLGDRELITQYGNIMNHNKAYRVIFYLRNHIRKSGFVRNIGLLIYG